jgi:hypothetical protein
LNQACPKCAAFSEAWPAASPLAVRKGWAFPSCQNTNQPHPRRLEGIAFQAARMRNNHMTWPGKAEPFRTAERQSRVNYSGRSLIRTALTLNSRGQGHAFCARRPRIESLSILPNLTGSKGSAPPGPTGSYKHRYRRFHLRLLTVFPLRGTRQRSNLFEPHGANQWLASGAVRISPAVPGERVSDGGGQVRGLVEPHGTLMEFHRFHRSGVIWKWPGRPSRERSRPRWPCHSK